MELYSENYGLLVSFARQKRKTMPIKVFLNLIYLDSKTIWTSRLLKKPSHMMIRSF
jgi:hypothetical protein